MITTIAATAFLLLGAQTAPQIKYDDGRFIISTSPGVSLVEPTKPAPAKKIDQIVFRKNNNFAVWDGRGLSIRHKNRTKSSKLVDIALTPKLFSREQILKTRELISKGVRQKEVSALSGARRVGNEAYFLARWKESSGKTWLEALIKVDLDSDKPIPQLVGKFDGLSLAKKPLDDQMFILNGALSVITQADGGWNLTKYDVHTKTFSAFVQGLDLVSFMPLNEKLGLFVERTSDGASVVGRVDLINGSRRNLLETRKKVTILDHDQPGILILDGTTLHNLESSMQTPMPVGAVVKRTGAGVLVYWPATKPSHAILLDPDRWTPITRWARDTKTNAVKESDKKPTKKSTVKAVSKKTNSKVATKTVKKKATVKKAATRLEKKDAAKATKKATKKPTKKAIKPTAKKAIKPNVKKKSAHAEK
jgi:hypothetical protein